MANGLEHRQEQRYAVLRHMYDVAVEGANNPSKEFYENDVAKGLGYPTQDVKSALSYLKGKNLVEVAQIYHGPRMSYRLTHWGIEEIEQSLQEPKERTEHFPFQIIQNFNATVGAVQTGTQSTANITQNIGVDLSDVFILLEQLKPKVVELPPEQQGDALDSIDALEGELKSQDKSPRRIRELLEGLGGIARGTVTFASQVAVLAQQLKNLGVF